MELSKSNKQRKWVIIAGGNQFGTDSSSHRLTRYKDKATRFARYDEALWRSECVMNENPHKIVRIVRWREKSRNSQSCHSSE